MQSITFLTNEVSATLRDHGIAHSVDGVKDEIALRVNRARSFAEIVGGTLANYLIQTDISPDLINALIDRAIERIQIKSLEKQF